MGSRCGSAPPCPDGRGAIAGAAGARHHGGTHDGLPGLLVRVRPHPGLHVSPGVLPLAAVFCAAPLDAGVPDLLSNRRDDSSDGTGVDWRSRARRRPASARSRAPEPARGGAGARRGAVAVPRSRGNGDDRNPVVHVLRDEVLLPDVFLGEDGRVDRGDCLHPLGASARRSGQGRRGEPDPPQDGCPGLDVPVDDCGRRRPLYRISINEEVCMVRCGGFRRWLALGFLVFVAACFESVYAQAPAPAGRGSTPAGARGAAPAPQQPRTYANMLQLMRGTLYPQSNVIFTAQVQDPGSFKPADHQSTSSDPFTSAYGGWEAVENSGMAMAETANLLLVARQCSNGKPAPVQNADWQMWVQELREASMGVYKAGQAKNDDVVLEAADKLATACLHCHAKYRNVPGGVPNRC